jgi:hydroxymethylbilane synthase
VSKIKKIVIGSRGSILAVKQSEIVIEKLKQNFSEYEFELKIIKTSGDKNLNYSMQKNNIKNMFVKEIEEELLQNKIDLAVHSMKDMPKILPKGLTISSIPDREDTRDVLISKNNIKFDDLPKNAIIGTSSIRRKIQLLSLRDDIIVKEIRGNIHTRIDKMLNGDYDAIVLAYAGVKRANLTDKITQIFSLDEMIPSPCQGAICIEAREDDEFINNILNKINDVKISIGAKCEREFTNYLDGGCKVPVGAYSEINDDKIKLTGFYSTIDDYNIKKVDKESIKILTLEDKIENYIELAKNLAERIKFSTKKRGHRVTQR